MRTAQDGYQIFPITGSVESYFILKVDYKENCRWQNSHFRILNVIARYNGEYVDTCSKKLNRHSSIVHESYSRSTVVVNNFITQVLRLNESPERAFISVPDENIYVHCMGRPAAYYSDRMINTRRKEGGMFMGYCSKRHLIHCHPHNSVRVRTHFPGLITSGASSSFYLVKRTIKLSLSCASCNMSHIPFPATLPVNRPFRNYICCVCLMTARIKRKFCR